ncbi:unnamed protein product [Mytilus coruscus]|uniref:ZMYM2-like/QRICH1 C-terminal domain-containing protein n=1 Tax=Mytilus coruscus TaxID=42192 RepID=A0A6J8BH18_MYTCO|nr:unnamed protein product [Mytilus coruscus]
MDPYSAVFNEYLDPLYLEDDYEVPQFDVQYAHQLITTPSNQLNPPHQLKQLGLGNHPNAAEVLESDDEEELYRSGGFGTDDPNSLLSTIWYMNTIHVGLRGSHEHRQLKWGDIELETDRNKIQYLSYNERLTKTRDGSNTKNTRAYAPKSWSNPQDERKCHIATYLKVIINIFQYKFYLPSIVAIDQQKPANLIHPSI